MTFLPEHATDLWQAAVSGILTYFAIPIAFRQIGLRSFVKMAPHFFGVIVAIGSVLASAAMADSTPLAVPLVAIALLFLLQLAFSGLSARLPLFTTAIINAPILPVQSETILHGNCKVSDDKLRAKLRVAIVTRYDKFRTVVFEATGDISVLHAEPEASLGHGLLSDVKRDA